MTYGSNRAVCNNRSSSGSIMRSAARYREARPTLTASLLFTVLAVTGVRGLSNVSIDIPMAVAAGATVNMSCKYDLGMDDLYTVKWYKGTEFFRYVPKELPPIAVFGDLGDKVIRSQSDAHRVVVQDVQPKHTGKYRCEVSGDSPSFDTIIVYGYMYVASLPDGDPYAMTEKSVYSTGETVRGNCTVPWGNPPANVTWTVNGVPVNASFMFNVTKSSKNDDNQQLMTVAGLEFEIISANFSDGKLFVVCHASVFHLYKKTAQTILYEERPRLSPVLGTHESSYTGSAVRRTMEWFYASTVLTMLLCSLR